MSNGFRLSQRGWPRRPMTEGEARLLASRARPRTDEVATLVALPVALALVGWGVGAGLAWWMQRHGVELHGAARVALWSFLVVGLVLDALVLRLMHGARARERADLRGRQVELIRVAPRRVLDVGTEAHPALLFDGGDGTLVYLGGRFLLDPGTFEGDGDAGHAGSRRFPCSRFTVVRAPRSGAVLRLETAGSRLEPSGRLRPPGMRLAMLEWREAEVVEGALEGSPGRAPRGTRSLEAASRGGL